MRTYVHGYSSEEGARLQGQAGVLADLIHSGTSYAPGARVLEAGCGVGAQTVTLARRSPEAQFTSVDLSAESVRTAQARVREAGLSNVSVRQADLFALPFEDRAFDHAFVCFVLEHLADPEAALRAVCRAVRPGGSVTVVEGDHGSALVHPETPAVRTVVGCLVELQARAGGDACIGRRLYPLLAGSGLTRVQAEPRIVYADGSRPDTAYRFTLRTFADMVAGVRSAALEGGLADADTFDAGLRDLRRAATPEGTMSYTFYKAVGTVPD